MTKYHFLKLHVHVHVHVHVARPKGQMIAGRWILLRTACNNYFKASNGNVAVALNMCKVSLCSNVTRAFVGHSSAHAPPPEPH